MLLKHKNRILKILLLLIIVNILFPFKMFGSLLPTFAVVEEGKKYKTAESSTKALETIAPVFNFQSKSQILMELNTGNIIYSNNENEKLSPASVTKVMTLILTMEAIDGGKLKYDDVITCSENASKMGGSQIWFKPGETLTVDEALKCICVVSANDVSVAMAEHIAGSEENFVQMMNEKAKLLGMENTHFMNAHGIDADNHYTSAKDIAIMSRELVLNHPKILEYTSIWMDNIRNGTFNLSNTNKLIRFYDGAMGLKTGSTSKALFNLSAVAKRDNMTLIAVVMTAPTGNIRTSEITELLNYGFANYQIDNLAVKKEVVKKIYINKNISDKLEIVTFDNAAILSQKGNKNEYTSNIILNENLVAPILAGTKVGNIEYKDKEGNVVITVDLIVKQDVLRSNFLEYIKKIIKIYGTISMKNIKAEIM